MANEGISLPTAECSPLCVEGGAQCRELTVLDGSGVKVVVGVLHSCHAAYLWERETNTTRYLDPLNPNSFRVNLNRLD